MNRDNLCDEVVPSVSAMTCRHSGLDALAAACATVANRRNGVVAASVVPDVNSVWLLASADVIRPLERAYDVNITVLDEDSSLMPPTIRVTRGTRLPVVADRTMSGPSQFWRLREVNRCVAWFRAGLAWGNGLRDARIE